MAGQPSLRLVPAASGLAVLPIRGKGEGRRAFAFLSAISAAVPELTTTYLPRRGVRYIY